MKSEVKNAELGVAFFCVFVDSIFQFLRRAAVSVDVFYFHPTCSFHEFQRLYLYELENTTAEKKINSHSLPNVTARKVDSTHL